MEELALSSEFHRFFGPELQCVERGKVDSGNGDAKTLLRILQGGPLLVINRVITPINGLVNG